MRPLVEKKEEPLTDQAPTTRPTFLLPTGSTLLKMGVANNEPLVLYATAEGEMKGLRIRNGIVEPTFGVKGIPKTLVGRSSEYVAQLKVFLQTQTYLSHSGDEIHVYGRISGGGGDNVFGFIVGALQVAIGVAITVASAGALAAPGGALVGSGVNTTVYSVTTDEEDMDLGDYVKQGLVGGATGWFTGGIGSMGTTTAGKIAATAVAGAVGNTTNKTGQALASGEDAEKAFAASLEPESIFKAAATGALGGAIGGAIGDKVTGPALEAADNALEAAVAGAISGGLGGAASGAATKMLTNLVENKEFFDGVGESAASGAVVGGGVGMVSGVRVHDKVQKQQTAARRQANSSTPAKTPKEPVKFGPRTEIGNSGTKPLRATREMAEVAAKHGSVDLATGRPIPPELLLYTRKNPSESKVEQRSAPSEDKEKVQPARALDGDEVDVDWYEALKQKLAPGVQIESYIDELFEPLLSDKKLSPEDQKMVQQCRARCREIFSSRTGQGGRIDPAIGEERAEKQVCLSNSDDGHAVVMKKLAAKKIKFADRARMLIKKGAKFIDKKGDVVKQERAVKATSDNLVGPVDKEILALLEAGKQSTIDGTSQEFYDLALDTVHKAEVARLTDWSQEPEAAAKLLVHRLASEKACKAMSGYYGVESTDGKILDVGHAIQVSFEQDGASVNVVIDNLGDGISDKFPDGQQFHPRHPCSREYYKPCHLKVPLKRFPQYAKDVCKAGRLPRGAAYKLIYNPKYKAPVPDSAPWLRRQVVGNCPVYNQRPDLYKHLSPEAYEKFILANNAFFSAARDAARDYVPPPPTPPRPAVVVDGIILPPGFFRPVRRSGMLSVAEVNGGTDMNLSLVQRLLGQAVTQEILAHEHFKKKVAAVKKQFETLLENLNVMTAEHNLEVYDVLGDGNCFFRSVADQLAQRYGETHTHTALREMAYERINSQRERFSTFLLVTSDSTAPEEYIANVRKDGNWADEPEMIALAEGLDLTIISLRNDNTIPNIINPGAGKVIFVGYLVGLHYVSLRGEPSQVFLNSMISAPATTTVSTAPLDQNDGGEGKVLLLSTPVSRGSSSQILATPKPFSKVKLKNKVVLLDEIAVTPKDQKVAQVFLGVKASAMKQEKKLQQCCVIS